MHRELRHIEWFRDNVGKTIYGTSGCDCSVCHAIYLRGIKVTDDNHAKALFFIQDTTNKRYFTSKDDRVEYERSLKG